MKVLAVTLLGLVAVVSSKNINSEDVVSLENNGAFGYHMKFGIAAANEIREAETKGPSSRISGGSAARLGDFPYQTGLIIDLITGQQSVCGGVIVNNRRVLTAAHCWSDGQSQAWRFTVVAGSVTLFRGGQRLQTSNVAMHANWNPILIRDDIAIATLNSALSFSNIVAAVALPTGDELTNSFVGFTATASGFGRTGDASSGDITQAQFLSHANVPVITNAECQRSFGIVTADNICTSGANSRNPCRGDSGGPLVVWNNNRRVLVGIVSFGEYRCQQGFPAAYVRVTNYINWINARL